MATATKDIPTKYDLGFEPKFGHIGAVATDVIFAGSAVGVTAGTGRPLVAADPFAGFAEEQCDNAAGAASAKDIKLRTEGARLVNVVGSTAITDRGSTVYMSDDTVFTLASTGNTSVGKVLQWFSGTSCRVFFQAAELRSL